MTKVTIYSNGSDLPNALFLQLVKAARSPIWAGQPTPQYATARAIFVEMQKLEVLLLGQALRYVFQQVVIEGFVNNPRFTMPKNDQGASGTSAGAIAGTRFINEIIREFREILADGYGS